MNLTRGLYNNNTSVNGLKDSHCSVYLITIMSLVALGFITLNVSISEYVCVCV